MATQEPENLASQKEALSKEHEIRVEKIAKLKTLGIQAWPAHRSTEKKSSELKEIATQLGDKTESETTFSTAGRIISRRSHGKSAFCTIQDSTGSIQLYLKKDLVGAETFDNFEKLFDIGDIIWVSGLVFITRTGEATVKVNELQLLSKCLHPLPEKHHGLTDTEQRYRQRYLDLLSNPESKEKFITRSKIVKAIRTFLSDQGFLEVETPMLHPIPGGAAARPFITKHNAYGMDLYLRIAPELYLKRLVVGGLDRVFEINRNFRNEGVSTKHNPEFTMLEFYMAYGDYNHGMNNTEELIRSAARVVNDDMTVQFKGVTLDFLKPFARMTVKESLISIGELLADQLTADTIDTTCKTAGIEPRKNSTLGEKLFLLFEELVEDNIIHPTFILGYPTEISPLAKRNPENPDIADRFELFVCGIEIANGFSELNDPFDQADRFRDQVQARKDGDGEAHHFDKDYVEALEYGLPPTVGVGIGIDRLVMLMTNTETIKDVILFPTMKHKSQQ